MNNINVFNKNEIENKLKDFQEGKDYSVSPTGDGRQFYNFFSDELKRFWGDDRILVNRVVETDSNKDYDYYGQFENYQDGSYRSFQSWSGKNFRQSESYKRNAWWEKNFPYRGPEAISESLETGRISGNHTPKQIEPNHDLKWKYNQLTGKLDSLLSRPESDFGVNGKEKKECKIAEVRKNIANIQREIEKEKNSNFDSKPAGCCNCGFKDIGSSDSYCQKCEAFLCDKAKSDLAKENQELKQQLTKVQQELEKVLTELKKLKNNINGKDNEKLNQQIIQNEKLIKEGKNISVSEVQEQVNKSQALMKEVIVDSFTASPAKDKENSSGSLPYLIGGSALVVSTAIIGYCLLKRKREKKTA